MTLHYRSGSPTIILIRGEVTQRQRRDCSHGLRDGMGVVTRQRTLAATCSWRGGPDVTLAPPKKMRGGWGVGEGPWEHLDLSLCN